MLTEEFVPILVDPKKTIILNDSYFLPFPVQDNPVSELSRQSLPAHLQIQYNHRMRDFSYLRGVYVAAVTPLQPDHSLDLESVSQLLAFYAARGCHGALLFGTTGEGPSFAPEERLRALRAALPIRQTYPEFRLLAGTGTPSLEETIALTRASLDLGYDGVVVLPPYYFRRVSDEGLFAWFSHLIQRAIPPGKALLGYHFPSMSDVPLSIELLTRLREAFPEQFAGIKDSSGDIEHAQNLGAHFGSDLCVLTGNDRLFSLALENSASGCITALANVASPSLRSVWNSHLAGSAAYAAQSHLDAARAVLERYPPFPPTLKRVLNHRYHFPDWTVCPPLLPLNPDLAEQAMAEFDAVL